MLTFLEKPWAQQMTFGQRAVILEGLIQGFKESEVLAVVSSLHISSALSSGVGLGG